MTAALVRIEDRDAGRRRASEAQRQEIETQLDEFRKHTGSTRKVFIATGVTATQTKLLGTAGITAAVT